MYRGRLGFGFEDGQETYLAGRIVPTGLDVPQVGGCLTPGGGGGQHGRAGQ